MVLFHCGAVLVFRGAWALAIAPSYRHLWPSAGPPWFSPLRGLGVACAMCLVAMAGAGPRYTQQGRAPVAGPGSMLRRAPRPGSASPGFLAACIYEQLHSRGLYRTMYRGCRHKDDCTSNCSKYLQLPCRVRRIEGCWGRGSQCNIFNQTSRAGAAA